MPKLAGYFFPEGPMSTSKPHRASPCRLQVINSNQKNIEKELSAPSACSAVLEHFDQISEAPDAIPRLRRFILDLAVRGKLVEQDPHDEPAAKLLKRIEKEKSQLVKKGLIREHKSLEPFDEQEALFNLPMSWKWLRLGEVGAIVGGGTPPSKDDSCFTKGGSGIPWLTPADLGKHDSLFISHGARDLTPKGLSNSSAQLMPAGSVLFTSRAPIGYTAIAANEISTNQGFKSVVPFILEFNTYIAIYFKAFASWIDSKASGTTFKEVSGKIVRSLPFPLPPLAEQHRIVAKVDELMALCDELEKAQAKRESRRDRLVAASLHGMNNGVTNSKPDASLSFAESARFYFNHLPRLSTRHEHIQKLRQTILNLAVRGILVPQDPNDEPATQLIKRIEENREALAKEGKIKKQKLLQQITREEIPFEIPMNWKWVRFGNYFNFITDGVHSTPNYISKGVPFLSVNNLRGNKISFEGCKFISYIAHQELVRRCKPEPQDILVGKVGSLGVCDVITAEMLEFSIFVQLALFKTPMYSDPFYLRYMILSEFIQQCILDKSAGTALKYIGIGSLSRIIGPIPPLAEQHRIVAKVDELMVLCDELETQLTSTTATRRQLLESTLHEALN